MLYAVVTIAFENTLLVVDEGDGEVVVTVNVILPDNVTVEPGLRIPIVIETENGTAVGMLMVAYSHTLPYLLCTVHPPPHALLLSDARLLPWTLQSGH